MNGRQQGAGVASATSTATSKRTLGEDGVTIHDCDGLCQRCGVDRESAGELHFN